MAAILLVVAYQPLAAQGLRSKLADLFVFGSGGDQLFLAGSADPNNPVSVQAHADHFIPAAAAGNATLIAFITDAISNNVANVPISGASGGATFRFEGGVPIQTSVSPGPIFAERAQTLGRGRVLIGANISVFSFRSLRGVNLENIQLNFTHVNADFAGCDAVFGGDCSLMGIPNLENDVIEFQLSLDIDVTVTSFFLSYGLLDRVDVGVAIPIVSMSLRGTSEAQVRPFGGPTAAHFFAGTPDNPTLSATRFVEGNTTGIGDAAVRVKIEVGRAEHTTFSIMGDARLATGSEEDLLGSGDFSVRSFGILSSRFGDFAPHVNVGYLYKRGDLRNDAVLATIGFDQLLAPWAMIALDLVGELQVGDSELELPGETVYDVPFRRTVQPTSIPSTRDDLVNAAFGLKFITGSGITLVANSLWPINRGGLRPNVLWTGGLEYNF